MDENWFEDLNTQVIGRKIICLPKVTSTNDLAWLEVSRGAPEGTVIFAETQTKGRGRLNRTWFSPAGKGLWFSVILKPQIPVDKLPFLICFSALALCDMIKQELSLPALIRWPNDIMINNKKVAGLIVETRLLNKHPEATVLGIGFNITLDEDEIPAELKAEMTSLAIEKKESLNTQELARLLLCYLDSWYRKLINQQYETINSDWQKLSAVLNKQVRIKEDQNTFIGEVINLNPCDGITVQLDAQTTRPFRAECIESLRVI
jgi:BirA family transcriptional regulator, biotin operon repressor / biotin---[acetyl-CoA-carboxylase] ligase